jgi:hypothetical protein
VAFLVAGDRLCWCCTIVFSVFRGLSVAGVPAIAGVSAVAGLTPISEVPAITAFHS